MKKVLICGVIAASFGMAAAYAGTAPQNFDVKATVTAKCATNTVGTPVIDFGAVAAFGAAPANKTATISFKCTKGVAITAALSTTASTVAGLAYSLALGAPTVTAGAAATGSTGATADLYDYVVTGSMVGGQAGDTGAATVDTQTLTITF